MERTIYSKYSNERAERFRIRTDIVTDEAGEKKVYKYACTIQAGDHIRRQEELGKQLDAAYAGSRITFCPCTTEDVPGGCRSVSPFVQGDNLQHLMEQAVTAGDWETVEQMVAAYADRVSGSGGEIPFDRTPEFAEVFGEGKASGGNTLRHSQRCGYDIFQYFRGERESRRGQQVDRHRLRVDVPISGCRRNI